MPKELKVVVFDLDGTLADTANITLLNQGVRSPYDVLSLTPPMDNQKRLLFDNSMIYKISYLIQCGIHVYLITRSPKPYASTLAYLLGVDFCGLIPSNSTLTTVESKLAHISEITGAHKSEMLYIGDLEDDQEGARKFGCFFQYPTWTKENIEKTDLISPWFNLCYYRIIKEGGATGVAKTLESKYEERLRRHDLISNSLEQEYSFNESFSLCDPNGRVLLNDIFRVPSDSDLVMKPFVNPHIFTRFEYESDENLKNKLLDLIVLAGLAPARIKPPHNDGPDVLAEIELYASVGYWSEGFGSTLWGLIKNWSQSKGSGPKVHLHYMELVALGIAAGIYHQRLENEFAFLVPIPSTKISHEHPGQVSFRLSHRISQLTDIPLLNLMTKNEHGEFVPTMERYPFSKSIYLIDDQITSGKNARKCVEVLHKMGASDIKIFTWSASKFELIPG
jgi:hypothetical protein